MWFCDGPGTGSTQDVYKHSAVIRYGLQYEPLNTIFVAVPFHPRIEKIVEQLDETVSVLKKSDHHMVCVIVTKFNNFVPDGNYSEKKMKDEITEEIIDMFMDFDKKTIEHVMFDRGDADPAEA